MEKISWKEIKIGDCILLENKGECSFDYCSFIISKINKEKIQFKVGLKFNGEFNRLKLLDIIEQRKKELVRCDKKDADKFVKNIFRLNEEEKLKYYTKPFMLNELN